MMIVQCVLSAKPMELVSDPQLLTGIDTSQEKQKRMQPRSIGLILTALASMVLPVVLLYLLHRAMPVDKTNVLQWESSLFLVSICINIIIGFTLLLIALQLYRFGGKHFGITMLLIPPIAVGLFSMSNASVHLFLLMMAWKPTYWLALSIQYTSGITAMGAAIMVPPLVGSLHRLLKGQVSKQETAGAASAAALKENEKLRAEIATLKRDEDSERTNLQRVREIIDNLPLGAIAFDEADRVLHANTLFCQLFELNVVAQSLIGHHSAEFAELLQKRIRNTEGYKELLATFSAAKRPVLGTEILFQDGRIVAQDYIPLFAKDRYTGQLFLYRDITKEKRIDATKSEFMSLASHQLRTPLTTMRWALGRLNRSLAERTNEHEEKLLCEAKNAAGRMAHTIDTMLAISRIEAGKVSLELSEIKLGNSINEVRTEIREQYEQKQQIFTIDCPPGVHVQTDQYVFKEILRNLFTNAIKYTPNHGTIHVQVRALQQHVHLNISDSGYGIPTHQQEKIFSKFFRGDNIVQRDTEGTGLGLYLVFLLVKLLGATIFFKSEEGKGTTFTLMLPLRTSDAHPQETEMLATA